jgi:hypothetical protein
MPITILMSKKIQLIGLAGLTLISFGCSSDSPAPTPEEKKAFMGSAPPKGYMDNIHKGGPAAAAPGAGAPGPAAGATHAPSGQ